MASLDDLVSNIKNGVLAMGTLTKAIQAVFPQQTGTTATSASSGAATALPATPAGYVNVNINGTTVKVPFYNP